ncbi:MAG: DUF559 domain-containing protein [Clostridia bacterium]
MEEMEIKEKRYCFECWKCGIPVWYSTPFPILRPFCPDCKEEYQKEKEQTLREYIRLKTLVMHERALRILEKQEAKLFQYKEASEAVLEFALENPDKFASSHEMIAAMELIRHKIRIKTQQKIAGHRVDFVLPDLKVVLEIDGHMHQYHKLEDSKRDIKIRNELGSEWEVIRIPTKYIEQNAGALVTAIKELYRFKQNTRKKNNGVIPDWYSDREKMHYAKLLGKEIDGPERGETG